jgi:hypothetical protein
VSHGPARTWRDPGGKVLVGEGVDTAGASLHRSRARCVVDRRRSVTLTIYSARLSPALHDPDMLDIRRAYAEKHQRQHLRPSPGAFLAPSRELLNTALRARERVVELRREAAEHDGLFGDRTRVPGILAAAERLKQETWSEYEAHFLAEMRVSCGMRPDGPRWGRLEEVALGRGVRPARDTWEAFLRRERVVLACVCPDGSYCHRELLRTRVLPALGARDGGELP